MTDLHELYHEAMKPQHDLTATRTQGRIEWSALCKWLEPRDVTGTAGSCTQGNAGEVPALRADTPTQKAN